MVETLAGLPVGTWVRGRRGRLWCVLTYEIYKAGDVPHSVDYIPGADGMGYGPFTICRPPVGAVLPSARYAPEGTWLRDCDGDICHAPPDPSVTAPDRYAPFTVIADPREAPEPDDVVHGGAGMVISDGINSLIATDQSAASAAMERIADTVTGLTAATVPDAGVERGPSPVARMLANTRRTPSGWMCVPSGAHVHATGRGPMVTYDPGAMRNDSTRSTVSDSVGAIAEQVDWHRRKPEPMPRVDLITTSGDQSWRKARPVNRRPGRVEPVCGWSAYYD